jgi:hypothetical protein
VICIGAITGSNIAGELSRSDPLMPLRLFRGRVTPGREEDFITLLRNGIEREAPAPGLQTFMAGYRRVDGVERFILASAWDSDADLRRAVGDDPLERPNTLDKIAGVAEAESIDHFELIEPRPSGLLDAPGAVIRATHCYVRPGQFDALRAWLSRKAREIDQGHALLAAMLGWRSVGDRIEGVGVSAWPSRLQYEAIADAGLANSMLFRDMEQFVSDFEVEVYQAIELRLSPRLQAHGGRRLIVARFESADTAATARSQLLTRGEPSDAEVSIASMAASGGEGDTQVFVARVRLAEHAQTERLIADHGGQIVYEADEAHPPYGGALNVS